MTRRAFRLTVVAAVLSAGLVVLPAWAQKTSPLSEEEVAREDAAEKPNLLFIFADDIGYECLGSYGGLDFETPQLDRMAREGIRFSRAHTSPVCTPSRVSLHTGIYVPRHGHVGVLPVHKGTRDKVDFEALPTFAQQIRNNGYATSVTGKWQLATLEAWPDHIRKAGFDSWCIWQIWRDGAKTARHWGPCFNRDGELVGGVEKRFGPDVLNEYVMERMRAAKEEGKPFLILHNELLPHWPVVETPLERATGARPSLAGMIRYLDQLVGDLLDEVEKLGIRDHTYVFFMGDNGTNEPDVQNPHQDRPGETASTRHTKAGKVEGGKNVLNDAGSHVPLIVWGPESIPAGTVNAELVDVVDLFPTFCDLTGTPVSKNVTLDGRSIALQIQGREGPRRDWVHHALSPKKGGNSVFDGRFRLTDSGTFLDARQLPRETKVAAGDAEAAQAKVRLQAILDGISKDRPPLKLTFSD